MIPSLFKFFSLILVFTGDHTLHNHCYNHPKCWITTSCFSALPNIFLVAFVVPFIFPTAANSPLVLVPFAFFLLKFDRGLCYSKENLHGQAETQHRFFAWGVNWQDASWLWSGIWCRVVHKQIYLANTWIQHLIFPLRHFLQFFSNFLMCVYAYMYVCTDIHILLQQVWFLKYDFRDLKSFSVLWFCTALHRVSILDILNFRVLYFWSTVDLGKKRLIHTITRSTQKIILGKFLTCLLLCGLWVIPIY